MRRGLITSDVIVFLPRPTLPVRSVGVPIALQGPLSPRIRRRFDPHPHTGEHRSRRGEDAGSFDHERQTGVNTMGLRVLTRTPVPPSPTPLLPGSVRDEDVVRDILDGGIQAIPARVGRIQSKQLRRGIQRPALEKEAGQTRLAGPAAPIDQDDGRRRGTCQDVVAQDVGGIGQNLTDRVVTS